jgi:uncharacterized protein (DUF983 family)
MLLSNKCPKCNMGEIYRTFLYMNKSCPKCGHVYERERGYFTGAMFLDCIILPVSAIPLLMVFAYNDLILMGGFLCLLQMLLTSPFIFRYSRILWIRVGYQLDPDFSLS